MTVTLRPPLCEDAAEVADALNAVTRTLDGAGDTSVEDVRSWSQRAGMRVSRRYVTFGKPL